MALPVSDAFTSASDQLLTTYSASYSNVSNAFTVLGASDDVYQSSGASNGGEGGVRWNADTFNANHYASVKLSAVTVANFRGPAVRCSSSAATYYGFYADNAEHYLFKMVSGTWTQIGSTDGTDGAVNEVVRLEVSGTTLTPKINGSTWAQGAKTDSSISSGSGGMCGYGTSTSTRMDDFAAGNLSTSITGSVGLNTETDAALAMTVRKVKAPGITSETDEALSITAAGPITVAVGIVSETDSALLVRGQKSKTVGMNVEVDSALSIAHQKLKSMGLNAETDAALAMTVRKVKALGIVTETDAAMSISETGAIQRAVEQVGELDTALPMTAHKVVVVSQVSETDLAQALFPSKRVSVAQVVETDSTLTVGTRKQKVLGLNAETDDVLSIVRMGSIIVVVRQAGETDEALSILAGPFFGVGALGDRLTDVAIVSDTLIHVAIVSDALVDDAELEVEP